MGLDRGKVYTSRQRMHEGTAPVRLEWTITFQEGVVLAHLNCRDTVTQRDYYLEAPLHTLPALRDLIDDAIGAHPDLFPKTLIERSSGT